MTDVTSREFETNKAKEMVEGIVSAINEQDPPLPIVDQVQVLRSFARRYLYAAEVISVMVKSKAEPDYPDGVVSLHAFKNKDKIVH